MLGRSRSALVCIALGISAALLFTACAAKPSSPVRLTQKDNSSVEALSAGQRLIVSLDSNPSTGYGWAVDGEVPPQLEQLGDPKYIAGSGAIGSGGTQVWTFSAKASGEGILKLKYWRSFEPTATPVKTFEVTVEVK